MMYLRVTINTIARDKAGDLRQVINEMTEHRAQNGYTPVEWLTGLTGRPDELISVQRYEKLADYEAALGQIANDPPYVALLARLKECTVPGAGQVQLLKTF
jgi:hypothetical protein